VNPFGDPQFDRNDPRAFIVRYVHVAAKGPDTERKLDKLHMPAQRPDGSPDVGDDIRLLVLFGDLDR